MYLYVPDRVDVKRLPYIFEARAKYSINQRANNVRWLLSSFVTRYAHGDIHELESGDYYLPFNSRMLRRWVGDDYKRILTELEAVGWIEQGEYIAKSGNGYSYRSGHSKCYRLSDRLRMGGVSRVVVGGKFNRLVEEWRRKDYDEAVRELPILKLNAEQMKGFRIDREAYNCLINNESLSEGQRVSRLVQIDQMRELSTGRPFLFKYVPKCGRLFTPLTSLAKDLRKFVTYEGEEVWEVDIKCSQPYFLAMQVIKSGKGGEWVKHITEGDFYEQVRPEDWTRDDTKAEVLRLLYDKPYRPYGGGWYDEKMRYKSEVDKLLHEKFPELMSFAKEYKSRNGYKELALLMQRTEGDFVLGKVMDFIYEVSDELGESHWCASVHDSILCSKEFADILQTRVIPPIAVKLFGFAPLVKVKRW